MRNTHTYTHILSHNTVCCRIQNCNLKHYYARRKSDMKSMQKHCRVHRKWARAHVRWTVWQCSLMWSLFSRRIEVGLSVPKQQSSVWCMRMKPSWKCWINKNLNQLHTDFWQPVCWIREWGSVKLKKKAVPWRLITTVYKKSIVVYSSNVSVKHSLVIIT